MKKIFIVCFSILGLTSGCINKNEAKNNIKTEQIENLLTKDNMNIDTLKYYLKLQEKSPYVDDYDAFSENEIHIATIKDIELTLPFIKKGLIQNSFQPLEDSTFYSKIAIIFQNKIDNLDKANDLVLLLSAGKKNISREKLKNVNLYHFDSGNLFISTKDNLIVMPEFLNEFIEIDKDQLIYKKVPDELIALNLYLLNDRKAYFNILANIDSYAEEKGFLLKKIFYAFLYHNDNKLNDWIFKNEKIKVYNNNPNTFEPFKYIFTKENDSLRIDQQLINTITRLTSENDCYYLNLFGFYIYKLMSGEIQNNFSEGDKILILNTLIRLEYPLRDKYTQNGYNNDWGKYSFSSTIISNFPQLYENFKQEYANDRELQKMLSELIDEGNGVV